MITATLSKLIWSRKISNIQTSLTTYFTGENSTMRWPIFDSSQQYSFFFSTNGSTEKKLIFTVSFFTFLPISPLDKAKKRHLLFDVYISLYFWQLVRGHLFRIWYIVFSSNYPHIRNDSQGKRNSEGIFL